MAFMLPSPLREHSLSRLAIKRLTLRHGAQAVVALQVVVVPQAETGLQAVLAAAADITVKSSRPPLLARLRPSLLALAEQ
jgi:hypothetical protein